MNKRKELVTGRRNVFEALQSGSVVELWIMRGSRGKIEKVVEQGKEQGVPIKWLPKEKFREWTGQASVHQGIAALVEAYRYGTWEGFEHSRKKSPPTEMVLLLDHLQDPHNLGALIRTAEAAGVGEIIIPKDRSVEVNATVRKVSAGAAEWVSVIKVTNLVQTIHSLQQMGYWIYGASEEGACPYYQVNWEARSGLVLGGEGKGLSRLVKENCDQLVYIPMFGRVSSLNVSVSGALLMFEYRRRVEGWQ